MMHDLEALKDQNPLSTFIGQRLKLKREGREFVCLCPFHQEKTPSFKINDAKGMYYCFGCGAHGDIFDFVQRFHSCNFTTACEYLGGEKIPTGRPPLKLVKPAIEPLRSAPVPDSHIMFEAGDTITAWKPDDNRTTTYRPDGVWAYTTEAGDLTHYVIRINFDGGKKIFIPLRPVYRGDDVVWATAHAETPRPMYGLDRLSGTGDVVIVEGEKSADAASAILGGACLSAPRGLVDFTPLHGRAVTVWADADEAGQVHAERVATALLGVASAVRLIPWDIDKPKGWDAADALSEGLSADDIRAWFDRCAAPVDAPFDDPEADASSPSIPLTGFDGTVPPPRPWAYGDFLMEGAVTGVPSPAGTGKTTFAMQLAIAFALDQPLGPWTPRPGGGGKVWVLNGEEPKEELDRRFMAASIEAGIDPSAVDGRVFYNSAFAGQEPINLVNYDRGSDRCVTTPAVDRIKATIRANNIKLLILDPLIEFHSVKETDTEQFQAVGAALRSIAMETGCSLLVFHHTPKSASSENAGDMTVMRGSGSMLGVVRFVVTIFRMSKADAETHNIPASERNAFVRIDGGKANMGPLDGGEHWFRMVGVNIDNASSPRPADSVAALRYAPMQKADDRAERAERARTHQEQTLARVCIEVVRVCLANGWTAPDKAASLNTVCGALDRIKTGVAERTANDLLIGQREFIDVTDGYELVISEDHRGRNTYRTIHIRSCDR